MAEDPDAALARRLELARQSGSRAACLERLRRPQRRPAPESRGSSSPTATLGDGDEVETDHGSWHVHRDPGPRAVSHRASISPRGPPDLRRPPRAGGSSSSSTTGTPRIRSESTSSSLDGSRRSTHHPLPAGPRAARIRDVPGKVAGLSRGGHSSIGRVRGATWRRARQPRSTSFPSLMGGAELNAATVRLRGLQMVLAYLDHLTLTGEAGPRRRRRRSPLAFGCLRRASG